MNARNSLDNMQQLTAGGILDAIIINQEPDIGQYESLFDNPKTEPKFAAFHKERRKGTAMLLTVREFERQRIAMDLHDGLGQSLTLIKVELLTANKLLKGNINQEVDASLQRLKQNIQNALEELRHTVMNLRPPMIDDLGILATLSWFFREFETACSHIKIEKDLSVQECHIPEPLKIVIFRILQESVSNVVKHSNADRIQVNLRKTRNTLHFSVADNGNGFNPAQTAIAHHAGTGRGLPGIKERVLLSGGEYVIESATGKGTRISISWLCR
ncbi:MAG: sensor histidine kinase [bacterium]